MLALVWSQLFIQESKVKVWPLLHIVKADRSAEPLNKVCFGTQGGLWSGMVGKSLKKGHFLQETHFAVPASPTPFAFFFISQPG